MRITLAEGEQRGGYWWTENEIDVYQSCQKERKFREKFGKHPLPRCSLVNDNLFEDVQCTEGTKLSPLKLEITDTF